MKNEKILDSCMVGKIVDSMIGLGLIVSLAIVAIH